MPAISPAANEDEQDQLIEEHYVKCLQKMIQEEILKGVDVEESTSHTHCPMAWDGILCWGETEAGVTATLPCPNYVAGFETAANATRQCLESGEWYSRPDMPNGTWTNFSQCAPPNLLATFVIEIPEMKTNDTLMAEWVPIVKTTASIGYGISLFTLILAFVIMASIRRLHCPRNVLHMHLFVSFMMRAFMSLLKDSLFIKGIDLAPQAFVQGEEAMILSEEPHGWPCKLVICIWQFFILANYSWVFMEGLYLHNLIFHALFSDSSSISMYVILGWGLPVLVVVPWIAFRAVFEDTYCWTINDNPIFFLIIRIPIEISILINFVLFVKIVRVVFLKLQSSISEETRRFRYRRWAKSTLVLVPLFGIHYTIFLGMSYSIGINPLVEIIWLFCDLFFASFQGAFVAVLYCFMNGEVKTELLRIWARNCQNSSKTPERLKPHRWPSSGAERPLNGGEIHKPEGVILSYPQEFCDTVNNKVLAGEEGEINCMQLDATPSKTEVAEVQLQPIRSLKFRERLRRQMSAPPGVTLGGSAGGLVARAVRSDVVQSTKMMARKWRSRLGSKRSYQSSPFVSTSSSSGRTTHCTFDFRGGLGRENPEATLDVNEERLLPLLGVQGDQDSEGVVSQAVPEQGDDHRKKSLERSKSAGLPSKPLLSKHSIKDQGEDIIEEPERNGDKEGNP